MVVIAQLAAEHVTSMSLCLDQGFGKHLAPESELNRINVISFTVGRKAHPQTTQTLKMTCGILEER